MPKCTSNNKTKSRSSFHPGLIAFGGILALTLLSGALLTSSKVNADDDTVVDDVSIEIPISCSMSGTGMNTHNATLMNGIYSGGTEEYSNGIGSTTLSVYCNDNNGFSIYAIGYTNNEEGNNTLKGANTNITIPTGLYTSGTTTNSTWSMKITEGTDSGDTQEHPLTIDNDFDDFHTVPGEQEGYTKVAHKTAATAMSGTPSGATLTTTYDAYISTTQAADTYTGQVKYVMVHPYDHREPAMNPATLDTGQVVNDKLWSLAVAVAGETPCVVDVDAETGDTYNKCIKSIDVHLKTSAPTGITPTADNTISASNSQKPVYIIFDNTNDAGIMHFYTEGDRIVLPADSSSMFRNLGGISDLSDLSDWDVSNVTDMNNMFNGAGYYATTFALDLSSWNTSNVTNMSGMFSGAGYHATTWSIGDLSSWNTANVTDMSGMFYFAGRSATTWSIGDLSSWNTANVMNMNNMFNGAGYSASTFTLDLSGWNTSNVTNMSYMFANAGPSASTFTLNLSGWNTSNVTNMSDMFYYAGSSASTWSVTIPQTNGNNINNTTTNMYGQDASVYGEPDSGKSFTLAQP